MTPAKPPFTQSELKSWMDYNSETGTFTRTLPSGRVREISAAANTLYVQVRILHRCYYAHQLAWYWVHGEWPSQYIDHINQNKKDNRICNLRVVSQATNLQNMNYPGKRNKSGYLGVCFTKNRWRAAIYANGKSYILGYFNSPEDANAAYLTAKPIYHPLAEQCLRPVPEGHCVNLTIV